MFCPTCRSEFVDGITTCASCEVPLVEKLANEDIFASESTMAAYLAERELIPIVSGHHVALQETQRALTELRVASVIAPDTSEDSGAPGTHQRMLLLIDKEDLDRVRQSFEANLHQGLKNEGLAPMAEELDAETCPACGASVPVSEAECPDCGLMIGVAE